jgi:hypothetical protein
LAVTDIVESSAENDIPSEPTKVKNATTIPVNQELKTVLRETTIPVNKKSKKVLCVVDCSNTVLEVVDTVGFWTLEYNLSGSKSVSLFVPSPST